MEQIEEYISGLNVNGIKPEISEAIQHSMWCDSMTNDRNQGDTLAMFRRFEDDDQKAQRERLYRSLTGSAIARPRRFWKKIARVQGVSESVLCENEENRAHILATVGNFDSGKSLKKWLVETIEETATTDPNAWILYERRNVSVNGIEKAAEVFPVVLPSEVVYDFGIESGKPTWLTIKTIRPYKEGNIQRIATDYMVYMPGVTYQFLEITKGLTTTVENEKVFILNSHGKNIAYLKRTFETGTTEVPAMRVGSYKSSAKPNIFVSWYYCAKSVLDDLIRAKSNFDVLIALHVFRRRYEFVKTCKHRDPEQGECVRGYLNGDAKKPCPSCGGTGIPANFTSDQSVLQLSLPNNAGNDILNLASLYHVEPVDVTLPGFIEEMTKKAEWRVYNAVINTGAMERATGVEQTATEMNYAYEDVYDVLEKYVQTVSEHFALVVRVAGQYLETIAVGELTFPKDFKMRSISELTTAFQNAKQSGAGWESLKWIRTQIWEKLNESDPERVLKIQASYEWLPWDDKSDSELASIMASRSPLDNQRLLRENWAEIFGEIEQEHPQFYKYEYAKQKEVVYGKVEQLKAGIKLAEDLSFSPTDFEI